MKKHCAADGVVTGSEAPRREATVRCEVQASLASSPSRATDWYRARLEKLTHQQVNRIHSVTTLVYYRAKLPTMYPAKVGCMAYSKKAVTDDNLDPYSKRQVKATCNKEVRAQRVPPPNSVQLAGENLLKKQLELHETAVRTSGRSCPSAAAWNTPPLLLLLQLRGRCRRCPAW